MEENKLEKLKEALGNFSFGRMCHLSVMVEILGYDFDDAFQVVTSKSMEELDKITKINCILESLVKQIPLQLFKGDVIIEDLDAIILSRSEENVNYEMFFTSVARVFKQKVESENEDSNELEKRIKNLIFAVHNDYVENSVNLFKDFTIKEKLQMLPIELIGLRNIEKELLCIAIVLYWFKFQSLKYYCGYMLYISANLALEVEEISMQYLKENNLLYIDGLNKFFDSIENHFTALSNVTSQSAVERLKWIKSESGRYALMMELFFSSLQFLFCEDGYDFKEKSNGEIEYFPRKKYFAYANKYGLFFELDRNGKWVKIGQEPIMRIDIFENGKTKLSKEQLLKELNQSNENFERQFILDAIESALQVLYFFSEDSYYGISLHFKDIN